MTARLVERAGGLAVEETGRVVLVAPAPVGLRHPGDHDARWSEYGRLIRDGAALRGEVLLELPAGGALRVEDVWRLVDGELLLDRDAVVVRGGDVAFSLGAAVHRPDFAGWDGVAPFAPGAVYGDDGPVAEWTLGGLAARGADGGVVLVRADRLAAPVLSLYADGAWTSIADREPDGRTVLADAIDRAGSVVVAAGIRVLSLGAAPASTGMVLQAWQPAIEGAATYDSGALPLGQHPGWRERFQPAVAGERLRLRLAFAYGAAAHDDAHRHAVWRAAWERHRPAARAVAVADFLDDTIDVLASQVRTVAGVTGIGLESDPVAGAPLPGADAAVMGFVGANTDAAAVLLRAARDRDEDTARRLRAAARGILDTFATLPLDPPVGEGFSLADGRPTTYRTVDGTPAVFLRALAEGAAAALRAADLDDGPSAERWRRWALSGAAWLATQQRADGTFPRAWEADTGRVLQESSTATVLAVPFLLLAAGRGGEPGGGDAALRAAEAAWDRIASGQGYAGATLDNPDVVDKEAAVLALEAFLAVHDATGDAVWVARAVHAAAATETWIHLWDIPMPDDADDDALHWKHGRPTTGMQLITTGVTMSDGFLVANAGAFARLATLTGDAHWREVAVLVHRGALAMLATRREAFDLAGPGWQQEHWNLGPARGFGLNRSWLPWTAVAVAGGTYRLIDGGHRDVLD